MKTPGDITTLPVCRFAGLQVMGDSDGGSWGIAQWSNNIQSSSIVCITATTLVPAGVRADAAADIVRAASILPVSMGEECSWRKMFTRNLSVVVGGI